LSFVTCVILLEVFIGRWSTEVIKEWTWSATVLKSALAFKQSSIGTKMPKVCQENTITPATV